MLEPGRTLGGYRVEAMLGEGAMGVVYRATRVEDGTLVALKTLRSELSGNDTFRRRFLHEARSASEVKHRHLVPILDAGEADGQPYMAVRFLTGGSLDDALRSRGPFAMADSVRVVAQVASALDALHQHGIIHRDVKAANVLLEEDGSACLTDFGLAKGAGYTALTRPGQVLGTFDYMAPEIISGKAAGPAADIYALGCLAYELLTGGTPFAGKALLQLAMAHLDEDPPPLTGRAPGITPELSWAFLQALAKDPATRPPTATAYAAIVGMAARTAAAGGAE